MSANVGKPLPAPPPPPKRRKSTSEERKVDFLDVLADSLKGAEPIPKKGMSVFNTVLSCTGNYEVSGGVTTGIEIVFRNWVAG